jgi:acyl-homoserine-lactone acylase
LARTVWTGLDDLTRALCEGFARGVNAWMVDHPGNLPAWAGGVRPEDILALWHCYLMSHAPIDMPGVYRRPAASLTGNAWAVSGKRSATGDTLLVINPHGAYEGPFRWYEAHLVCGEIYHVAGATLFGLPVILQGHNGLLGWGLTPNHGDWADVYIEGAGNVAEQRRTESFGIMTATGMREGKAVTGMGAHGPLLGEFQGRACTLQAGGFGDLGGLAQVYQMGAAINLAGFREALAMHQMPCFHVVYGDREGNVFYAYNIKCGDKAGFVEQVAPEEPGKSGEKKADGQGPSRVQIPVNWNLPVPGDNSDFAWKGIIVPGNLPVVLNPLSGYVQACGNPPWLCTSDSGLNGEMFPGWFAQDRDTYSAQRVRKLLEGGQRTVEDMQSMLYDTVGGLGADLADRLSKAAMEHATFMKAAHPDTASCIELLKGWNGAGELGGGAMTYFSLWYNLSRPRILNMFPSEKVWLAAFTANAPEAVEPALAALSDAAGYMRNEFDGVGAPWGDVHTLKRGLKEISVPGSVSAEPIWVMADAILDRKKIRVDYGYGYAMIVQLGEKVSALSMSPFGSSESSASAHYDDQLPLLAERRLKKTRFDAEDVQQNAERVKGCTFIVRARDADVMVRIDSPTPVEARLRTEAPDGKVPENLRIYGKSIKLEIAPALDTVSWVAEWKVGEDVAPGDQLSSAKLFSKSEDGEWKVTGESDVNMTARTLVASGNGGGLFAVIGN